MKPACSGRMPDLCRGWYGQKIAGARCKTSCEKERQNMEEESDTGQPVQKKDKFRKNNKAPERHNLRSRKKGRLCFYVFLQENDRLHKRPAAGQNHCHGLCTGGFWRALCFLKLPVSVKGKGRCQLHWCTFTSTSAVCYRPDCRGYSGSFYGVRKDGGGVADSDWRPWATP